MEAASADRRRNIRPEWRGHRYFVVRDEIVIVDRELDDRPRQLPVGGSSTEPLRTRRWRRSGSGAASVSLSVEEIRRCKSS